MNVHQRTRKFFSGTSVRMLSHNVVHWEKLLAADDDTYLQVILQDPVYRSKYFTEAFTIIIGRMAISANAWKCLTEMMSACLMTSTSLVSLFNHLCKYIGCELTGEDEIIALTDLYPSPATMQRDQDASTALEAFVTGDHSASLAKFHSVCTILATATNTKGNPLHLDRCDMRCSLGGRLAWLMIEDEKNRPGQIANDLVHSHLTYREWMDLALRTARTANTWLPFFPLVEHLWAAAIHLLSAQWATFNPQPVLHAITQRHAELVSVLQKEVAVHLIPDLANLVTSHFQFETPDPMNAPWQSHDNDTWVHAYKQRTCLLETYFPLTTVELRARKKKQRRKARTPVVLSSSSPSVPQ
jgi:hypothetical protein